MRWSGLAFAPLPVITAMLLAGACQQEPSAVALSMRVPQGLLDDAKVTLRVISSGARCDETTGRVTGSFDDDVVQAFELGTSGCESGAAFCQDITVEQSDAAKVFEVVATRSQEQVARGCTEVVVDQDPLEVSVSVLPFFEDKCCNDGRLQIGEQCDSGAVAESDCRGGATGGETCTAVVEDFACHCDCLAREIVLSEPSTMPPVFGNGVMGKREPAFAFAGGNAEGGIPGSFRAVFTDYEGDVAGDINQRILDADLLRAPGLLSQQLRLPQDCEDVAAQAGPGLSQVQPDIARLNDDLMVVAFADDREFQGAHEVRVVAQNAWGCNDTSPPSINACPACATPPCSAECPPTKVGTVQSGQELQPSIATNGSDRAMVVWVNGVSLRGRVWLNGADSACSTCLPSAEELTFGVNVDGRPRVTGTANGFLVAYSSADSVFYRAVTLDGAVAAEVKVNLTDGQHIEPDIAALPDGRFVVVWRTGTGQVLFQRFDASGAAVVGDQDGPLSVNSPFGLQPAVAGSSSAGTFWTAAWVADDGTAWARHIDAEETFLRNSVNGLLADFLASHPAAIGGNRVNPDVAIGGNGWVAIGWADLNEEASTGLGRGVRVRRFPLPE